MNSTQSVSFIQNRSTVLLEVYVVRTIVGTNITVALMKLCMMHENIPFVSITGTCVSLLYLLQKGFTICGFRLRKLSEPMKHYLVLQTFEFHLRRYLPLLKKISAFAKVLSMFQIHFYASYELTFVNKI